MPLVINSLGGGQTHTQACTHTDIHRPAHAWLNKGQQFLIFYFLQMNLIKLVIATSLSYFYSIISFQCKRMKTSDTIIIVLYLITVLASEIYIFSFSQTNVTIL